MKNILLIITLITTTNVFATNFNKPDSLTSSEEYVLAAKNYRQLKNYNSAINILKIGVDKFNGDANLLNELGEAYYLANKHIEAITNWENGIIANPNNPNNYYNAVKFYQLKNRPFKVLIFGEIFCNLEKNSLRTIEIKTALFDTYKVFLKQDNIKTNNDFEAALLKSFPKEKLSPSIFNIILFRTKFILNWWHNNFQEKYNSTLFKTHQDLIADGNFEAYNHWLFELVVDVYAYKIWIDKNKKKQTEFKNVFTNSITFSAQEYFTE